MMRSVAGAAVAGMTGAVGGRSTGAELLSGGGGGGGGKVGVSGGGVSAIKPNPASLTQADRHALAAEQAQEAANQAKAAQVKAAARARAPWTRRSAATPTSSRPFARRSPPPAFGPPLGGRSEEERGG